MGWIAGALSLGTMLATIPAGLLARKIGLQKALLSCFFLLPIVSCARTLVQSEALLVLLALIAGAVFAVWAVSLPPTVAALTTEGNRSAAFSLVFGLGIGSGILGGYLGGHLPSWCSSLVHGSPAELKKASLLLASLFVLVGALPCKRIAIARSAHSTQVTSVSSSKYLWRFLPPVAAWSFGLGILAPFLSIYMTKNLHLELAQVGSMFSLSQFLQMISVLAAPRIFRRCGTLQTVTLSQLAAAVALIAFANSSIRPWMLLSFAVLSIFQYMNEPGLYTLLMDNVAAEQQSSASAWNFFVICAAQSLAALIGGVLLSHFGYSMVLSLAAVVMALSAVSLYTSLRHGKES
jgi:predicted MFS family arabinose efflux permease